MPPILINREIAPVEQLALADIDVDILHQIITRAEKHPDVERLPFKAIFAEYDAVLAEYGIQPGRDLVYLRFLFQLGDKNLPGDDLYTRFETLLAHMGIAIESSGQIGYNEQSEFGSQINALDDHNTQSLQAYQNGVNVHPNKVHQRRASFNSMADVTGDIAQRFNNRPSSRSSVSRLETGTVGSLGDYGRNEYAHRVVYNRPPPPPSYWEEQESEDGRAAYMNQRLAGHGVVHPGIEWNQQFPGVTEPPTGQIPPRQHYPVPHHHDDDDDDEDESAGSSASDEAVERVPLPPELIYQPSISQLLRDASVFNMYREKRGLRHILTNWSGKVLRQRDALQAMQQIAINHDTKTLVRQALDIWQGAFYRKQQAAQTDRFFKHLEKRATRARDLYLLTKAFTHWSQVASDEIEKTAAARRHVLCIKYFSAWREITAVNELKAQRLAFRKPLKLMRARFQRIMHDEVMADSIYRRSLLRRIHWHWFWAFCDSRAPQWNEDRMKQRSLVAWLRAFRTQKEQDLEIDLNRNRGLVMSALNKWSQRGRAITLAQQNADSRWTAHVTGEYLTEWRVQRRLRIPCAQVTQMVNSRRLRSSANLWALRTRMELKARDVDRLRLMRNAWTIWNDKLRCQALTSQIEERLVKQALYKWMLMERLSLMTRIHQKRSKDDMLRRLMSNSRGLYNHLLHREEDFRAHRARELLRVRFNHWKEQLAIQRHRDHVALTFYAPRVQQESLENWKFRCQHIATIDSWAMDARYFFLTKKSVKHWKKATIDAAKKRRLDAYTAIRRKVKINMASQALSSWRSQTAAIRDLERQANEVYENKLIKEGTTMFSEWSQTAIRRLQNITDADIYYNRQLVYNHLTHWLEMHRTHRTQEEKASKFLEIHVSGVALAQYRKLSLRIFRIRTAGETADALTERNMRKHFRNMLHHWKDKTRTSLESNFSTTPLATPAPRYSLQPFTTAEEDWGDSDTPVQFRESIRQPDFTSHTPISTPGYLNTPSKRAARAKALFQASTTPATPLPTSFPSRLWAASEPRIAPAYSTNKSSAYRRSALSTNVRFAIDEEPESPTEGRSSNRITQ